MKAAVATLFFLALASASFTADAVKGMYECVGPRGEHYYSDKGCVLPDPPPAVPGGTLTLLPGRHAENSPPDPTKKFRTHNRYTQRAETGASTAARQAPKK